MKRKIKRFCAMALALSVMVAQIPILPVFATENSELEGIKAQLPYTGDISKMNLTGELALSMAEQIESHHKGDTIGTFVALFDQGNGESGLWLVEYGEQVWVEGMTDGAGETTLYEPTGELHYNFNKNRHYLYSSKGNIISLVNDDIYWNDPSIYVHDDKTTLLGYSASIEVSTRLEHVKYSVGTNGKWNPYSYGYLFYESFEISDKENVQREKEKTINETLTGLGFSPVSINWDNISFETHNFSYSDESVYTYLFSINDGEVMEEYYSLYDNYYTPNEGVPNLHVGTSMFGGPFYTGSATGNWDYGAKTASLLREYAELAQVRFKFPEFSLDSNITDLFSSLNLTGTMLECYEVAGNFYYVIMEENGVETGYLICAVKENGEIVYKIVHESTEILPEDTLSAEGNSYTFDSNIQVEFEQVKDFESQEEYVSYFRNSLQNITGTSLNDQGKSELALSMQDSIVNFATHVLHLSSGTGEIKEEEVTPMVEKSNGLYQDFVTLLREEQAELNKDLEQTVRVVLQGLDEENWTVYLNPDLIGQLQGNNLQVFLASGQQGLEVTAEDLESLLNTHDGLFINVQNTGNDQYAISFADNEGNPIEKLENPVKIFLPTTNEFATVMLDYAQGSENWGGQFNASTNTIQFSTIHSGTYVIVDNSVEIHDVNENYLSMIQFMVSKGFFEVDENGNFNPEGTMDRNQFTKTIVSMFFALDHDLKSDFPDVSPDSPYYSYIASGESRDIVAGYDDGFFHGDEILTEEMAFALIAQTLVDKKGYIYPEDNEFYLNTLEGDYFGNDWAKRSIALSIRDSIILPDETVTPTGNISRQNVAVYLYRLFMLLEEKQQINFELVEAIDLDTTDEAESNRGNADNSDDNRKIIIAIGSAGIGIAVTALALHLRKK